MQGLDYRFDISRASLNGFADDTNTKTLDVSGQLNYRISDSLKIWGAIEYREDRSKAYWGAPLVPIAFSGSHATSGIVSGNYVSNFNEPNLGADHDRRPHLQHQLQRPRQPQRGARGVAARRLRAEAGA